jgi:hypothetical protein
MYLLPENTQRRENVIAGLTAALVGVAMIAIAGKASAAADPAAHEHTMTIAATVKGPVDDGKKDSAAPAANPHGSQPGDALHRDHPGDETAQQGHDHGEHAKEADR